MSDPTRDLAVGRWAVFGGLRLTPLASRLSSFLGVLRVLGGESLVFLLFLGGLSALAANLLPLPREEIQPGVGLVWIVRIMERHWAVVRARVNRRAQPLCASEFCGLLNGERLDPL